MATCQVKSLSGEVMGSFDLPSELFDQELNAALLHQVVTSHAAGRRAGTHATKTRTTVHGSNRKPFRQKGTGWARQGTNYAPHMRGGGISHGPQPRSYEKGIPRKMRRAAITQMLSQRAREERCCVVHELEIPDGKTRELDRVKHSLGLGDIRKVLIIVPAENRSIRQAAKNIPGVRVALPDHLNATILLDSDYLILTPPAVEKMKETYGRSVRAR